MKSLRYLLVIAFAGFFVLAPIEAKLKSTKVPRYDVAVEKAVEFLGDSKRLISDVQLSLAAYALFKAGVPLDHPTVASGISGAAKRGLSQNYHGYDHIYMAGVDAMLLADVDAAQHKASLQQIADYISRSQKPDGSWSDSLKAAGDISMSQYGVLGLWAAARADCSVSPQVLDSGVSFFMKGRNGDGGWPYRPGTALGPGRGASTHNMTMAGGGCVAIVRDMFFGPRIVQKKKEEKIAGVLLKDDPNEEKAAPDGAKFKDYKAVNAKSTMDGAVDRALGWNQARFSPVSSAEHKIYFYYCLERTAALARLPEGWFTTYGDGLLSLQGPDGSFKTHSGDVVGTSFAVLYFMRSTKQILDKQYAAGLQAGGRLEDLRKKKETKELGPLDELLAQMQNVDFDKLDGIDAEAVAEKIAFGSREDLIGNMELLQKLREHSDPQNRIAAYFALGRTGDFALIPDMLKGLRDSNIDVNVQALDALRYLSRKPNGFGLTMTPFEGVETANDETKLKAANAWRTKAYKTWGNWYRSVRPFDESGGLDELELKAGSFNQ